MNEKGEVVADTLYEANARVIAQAPAMLRLLLHAPLDGPNALAAWLTETRRVLTEASVQRD